MPGLSGCLVPGGCLVLGGAWSRGGPVQEVVWSWGVSGPGGVWMGIPPRRLLLRAIHILLECILVYSLWLVARCNQVADLGAPLTPPHGPKTVPNFVQVFLQILVKSYVGAPPPPARRVGSPYYSCKLVHCGFNLFYLCPTHRLFLPYFWYLPGSLDLGFETVATEYTVNKTYNTRGIGNAFTYLDQYTLGPAYNEFGYNEHLVVEIRFLCIKLIDCNVKKFGYNKQPLVTSSFLCIFLLVTNPHRT